MACSLRVLFAGLVALVLLACVSGAEELSGPPNRPDVFRTPGELKSYLKALNEYFAIVGRPRFGRSVHKRSMEAFRRSLGPSAFDAMDIDGDGVVSPAELEFFINYN